MSYLKNKGNYRTWDHKRTSFQIWVMRNHQNQHDWNSNTFFKPRELRVGIQEPLESHNFCRWSFWASYGSNWLGFTNPVQVNQAMSADAAQEPLGANFRRIFGFRHDEPVFVLLRMIFLLLEISMAILRVPWPFWDEEFRPSSEGCSN